MLFLPESTSLYKDDERVKEHNAKNLIRMLTRLLFVWFVKEKNLIPDELFNETYIRENLINGFEPRKKMNFDHKSQGSKYYRAILQNLFFATLNQTVGKREFRKDGLHMNVTNLMRYEGYFKNPKAFIKLVENIVPFMNGGLFECLDSPDPLLKGKRGGDVIIYEDGFSDRKDNTLCVPDYIFFGTDERADLSEELGNKKFKDVTVNGLINILNSYKFTVTENTPIEEDVALDPELLGRVFENLLASYNPETKTTARKQTGSFYTPRAIVNYMVDESLKAYLKQKLETESKMKSEEAEKKLELLIDYNETNFLDENCFDDKQIAVIIKSIDNCKILDPACGSGAFPMGILHKLVHILHKLDPDNKLWKEVQRHKAIKETEEAFKIGNKDERENRLKEISDVFEYNSDDYGRKLFLIENCIYGVDIQPIATAISKLRFFISLIVDQKADKTRDNFGIRPLPNLETKFVAANTLVGIEKVKAGDFVGSLFDEKKVKELEDKLKDVRHRLFSAKTPATKRKLREEDQKLREEMGELLTEAGWGNETAKQLAGWDPHNQNASSPFFDPEWMFGVTDGFDVVIGNPPYVQLRDMADEQQLAIEKAEFKNIASGGRMNMFQFFIPQAIHNASKMGIICLITQNSLLAEDTAYGCRRHIFEATQIIEFSSFPERDNISKRVFEGVKMSVCVSILRKKIVKDDYNFRLNIWEERNMLNSSNISLSKNEIFLLFPNSLQIPLVNIKTVSLLKKIKNTKNIFKISVSAGEIDMTKYKSKFKSKGDYRVLHGAQVLRYEITDNPSQGTINFLNRKDIISNTRATDLYPEKRIVMQRITGVDSRIRLIMTITKGNLCANSTNYILDVNQQPLEYIIGILNSTLINFFYKLTSTNTNITVKEIEHIPIKIPTNNSHICDIVGMIISKKSNLDELELKLNQLVYKLYDLTEDEIAIIEGSEN